MKKVFMGLLVLALVAGLSYWFFPMTIQAGLKVIKTKLLDQRPHYNVADRLNQFGDVAAERLRPYFQQAKLDFPPLALSLLAFKDTKRLELYASDAQGSWHFIRSYTIQAASGVLGPKLREGDKQVPEGIYQIELLNPNSLYHVSLRLNYPNTFDQQMAVRDGRTQLGSDIMIHGKNVSIGCLAMGDEAAEELFALAAWVGTEQVKVVIAPTDFRIKPASLSANLPVWTESLYQSLNVELTQYPPVAAPLQGLPQVSTRHLN